MNSQYINHISHWWCWLTFLGGPVINHHHFEKCRPAYNKPPVILTIILRNVKPPVYLLGPVIETSICLNSAVGATMVAWSARELDGHAKPRCTGSFLLISIDRFPCDHRVWSHYRFLIRLSHTSTCRVQRVCDHTMHPECVIENSVLFHKPIESLSLHNISQHWKTSKHLGFEWVWYGCPFAILGFRHAKCCAQGVW